MRNDDGSLHFYVNGVYQGLAASNIPSPIYGVIDLYGQAAQATIVNTTGIVPICVGSSMHCRYHGI